MSERCPEKRWTHYFAQRLDGTWYETKPRTERQCALLAGHEGEHFLWREPPEKELS